MGLCARWWRRSSRSRPRPECQGGVSFLLAEQNTTVALRYADYGYILENGRVVMDGAAAGGSRRTRDVKEFSIRLIDRRTQELSRRLTLSPSQTLACLIDRSSTRSGFADDEHRIASQILRDASRGDTRHQMGGDEVYSVGGKMFAVFGVEPGKAQNAAFKCDPERFLELTDQPGIVRRLILPARTGCRCRIESIDRCHGLGGSSVDLGRSSSRSSQRSNSRHRSAKKHRRLRANALSMGEYFDLLETRDRSSRARSWRSCRDRLRMPKAMRPPSRASWPMSTRHRSRPQALAGSRDAQVGVARAPEADRPRRARGHARGAPRVFASPRRDLRAGEAAAPDYWRLARAALFAAGFRRGDLVHNCFAYHFTPAGLDARNRRVALGCTRIFPARHRARAGKQVQAMAELASGRLRRARRRSCKHHSRQGRRSSASSCRSLKQKRSSPAKPFQTSFRDSLLAARRRRYSGLRDGGPGHDRLRDRKHAKGLVDRRRCSGRDRAAPARAIRWRPARSAKSSSRHSSIPTTR